MLWLRQDGNGFYKLSFAIMAFSDETKDRVNAVMGYVHCLYLGSEANMHAVSQRYSVAGLPIDRSLTRVFG